MIIWAMTREEPEPELTTESLIRTVCVFYKLQLFELNAKISGDEQGGDSDCRLIYSLHSN